VRKDGKTNIRIVVEPHRFRGQSDDSFMDDCNQIKSQIEERMRKDDIEKASVTVEFDTWHECSICGREWEIDEDTNEPACCDAAVDEFRAAAEGGETDATEPS